jgi:hypothetical protein
MSSAGFDRARIQNPRNCSPSEYRRMHGLISYQEYPRHTRRRYPRRGSVFRCQKRVDHIVSEANFHFFNSKEHLQKLSIKIVILYLDSDILSGNPIKIGNIFHQERYFLGISR